MGATQPSQVRNIYDDMSQIAQANPDRALPESNERYDYLQERMRLVCRDSATKKSQQCPKNEQPKIQ
jgi:hypothetical protein